MNLRDQLIRFCPASVKYADALGAHMAQYGITSNPRIAAFLAQCAHESDGFHTAAEYASGRAYEGRADLGNTQPGDGPRFKGRGLIQTTGRANYAATSQALYGDDRLVRTPTLLEQPDAAVQSACWFWQKHGLNELADAGDFERITRRINGGLNGYDDRLKWWAKAKEI